MRWNRLVPLAIALATAAVWMLAYPASKGRAEPRAVGREISPRGQLGGEELATIDLFRRAAPASVFITTTALQRDRFSFRAMEIPRGTGSGFIWDNHGHIVTNFHVIEGAQRAEVTLSDQSTWDARFIGAEPDKDLAVLKIDAPAAVLEALPLGTSGDLQVGQKVFAIGNPFGLDATLTTGIISAVGREIQSVTRRPIQGVIQTDAAINPGNSGGPLLDSAGRLIGVNTSIYSPSGASAGVGFAVPVDTINQIVPQLIAYGRVVRPGLGVVLAPEHIAQKLRIEGLLVLEVQPGSAADRAGIRPTTRSGGKLRLGDIIVAIDGERVGDANDLFRHLDRYQVGDSVRLAVRTGSEERSLTLRLQELR